MASRTMSQAELDAGKIQAATSTLKRERLVSQAYFVFMTFGLWLGVGLPATWGGTLNGALLLVGAFSAYKVFTRVRVTI